MIDNYSIITIIYCPLLILMVNFKSIMLFSINLCIKNDTIEHFTNEVNDVISNKKWGIMHSSVILYLFSLLLSTKSLNCAG